LRERAYALLQLTGRFWLCFLQANFTKENPMTLVKTAIMAVSVMAGYLLATSVHLMDKLQ